MVASERNANTLLEMMGPEVKAKGGVDLVLECTGAPPCIQMGLFATRIRGRFVQVGMGASDVTIPIHRINIRVSVLFFLSLLSTLASHSDAPNHTLSVENVQKEIEMTGSFRYGADVYSLAIELVASGRIDVTRIVTHRYVFEDALKAFEATAKGKGDDGLATIKVQISQGAAPGLSDL